MRAVRVHETGGPEVLRVEDVEDPEPAPHEIRVRVERAGVNFIDTYHRDGRYAVDLPAPLGVEAGGVVDAVGDDVDGIDVGDRVVYTGEMGAYAELQVIPAAVALKVPERLDLAVAVAALLQGMTAHYLVHDAYPVSQDTTALVHAAAGGVGHLLSQMCKLQRGRVIATCGTRDKADRARSVGADEVVVYTEESFVDAVHSYTRGVGVDVVYDGVGRATFRDGLRCLRPRGMMVLYGQASGPVEPLDPQDLNRGGSLFLTRPALAHYTADRAELERRASDVFAWIVRGDLDVWIDRTFPLEDAAEAHRYLEGRQTRGKVLLEI